MEIGIIALIVFVSLFAIWLIFYFIPVGLWFSALVSGVRISLLQLILMRWRKVPPSTIVSSMIESTKAGLELNPNELEAHYLAGGNVTNVVHALVSAQKANIMLGDRRFAAVQNLAPFLPETESRFLCDARTGAAECPCRRYGNDRFAAGSDGKGGDRR